MNAKVIGVRFSIDPIEYYFISYIDVREGDTVVVDTRNGFAVAAVTSANVSGSIKATKEVVAMVDVTAFNERRARERRAAELREKMDAKVHELQEIAVHELLAKSDTELASMLDELNGLLG